MIKVKIFVSESNISLILAVSQLLFDKFPTAVWWTATTKNAMIVSVVGGKNCQQIYVEET